MDPNDFRPSHRQLVSAILSLVTDTGLPDIPPYLADLGYQLHSIELPMVDVHGHRYTPDLFVTNLGRHNTLLIDCKTWGPMIHDDQVSKYLRTSKNEVIALSGITPQNPGLLTYDAMFVVMVDAEPEILAAVGKCNNHRADGFGIVLVSLTRFTCPHNALNDVPLSNSLNVGWDVDLQSLELERLPFDPGSSPWEIADVIFQTVFGMWLDGVDEFTVDDICEQSNEWWPYLHAFQQALRKRISPEFRRIVKTALKDWIEPIRDGTNVVKRWRFKKPISQRRDVHDGFKRRQDRYVEVRSQRVGVVLADFDDIDRDQLTLTTVTGQPVDFGDE